MDKLVVHGGQPLEGTVRVSGSKNSALPILAACLLTEEECIIQRVPDLSDVHFMLQILSSLGAEVERASGTVKVRAARIRTEAPYDIVRKMRASVCVLGPLIGRTGEATVSLPGGCVIGERPIDLHLKGFKALGATVRVQEGNVKVLAPALRGAHVNLLGKHGSTVLGTDNLIMAAVLADGVTEIEGAACEPEVVDLANFLISMGAKIQGAGTSRIVIEGVPALGGTRHTVIPDRIEAGTFLVAGALCGKAVTIDRVEPAHLEAVTNILTKSGCTIESDATRMTIRPSARPHSFNITTAPYPGFPTDMQAQMCALLSVTPGASVVTEHVFPNRFMHIAELKRMGADAELEGATAIINGVESLEAAPVMASDLRASAALLLGGLVARGTTEIHRVYHIDRGYEQIDDKLAQLGAHIQRLKD